MMENNNLLLYKLLCKDKVGGVGRRVTVAGCREGREDGRKGRGGRRSNGASAVL